MPLTLKEYQKRTIHSLKLFFENTKKEGPATAFRKTVNKGLNEHYKPLSNLEDIPYIALRIPTGGGKTILGPHIIKSASDAYLDKEYPLVLWLVPTTQIKSQTLEALRDSQHPYRQELDQIFKGKIAIFDVSDVEHIRPPDIGTKVCIVISTVASLRVENITGRLIYTNNEAFEPHFVGKTRNLDYFTNVENGNAVYSFANVLALHRPLIITDEAHNVNTPLSYEVYERLSPKAIVEMTATPDLESSNVLISVSAFELKAENMIKLPVLLKEHKDDWQEAVSASVARRNTLAKLSLKEPDYIRPIILIQAENSRGSATVNEVLKYLDEVEKIDRSTIGVATGVQRELEGVDLFDRDCHIEIIITMKALKEGWDCSFAYVFCSVAQVKSDRDVQQLLGRVLRMPYAKKRELDELNKAYAHVKSESFGAAASEITKSLVDIGFNRMEAIGSVRRQADLEFKDTESSTKQQPVNVIQINVEVEPDLVNTPTRDHNRIIYKVDESGNGGIVEIKDEIDVLSINAIIEAVPKNQRASAQIALRNHQEAVIVSKAPSERGEQFIVPTLCMIEQGKLELVDKGAVRADFKLDILSKPPDLSSFSFNHESMAFEVDLNDKKIKYHQIKDDLTTYLPGFAQDRKLVDLYGWLDQNIRDTRIKQSVLREWIRRALTGLMEERGFSLPQLLKGQFVLRRKFQEQLDLAKEYSLKEGFQSLLFSNDIDFVSSEDPDYVFAYPSDMSLYPARSYYSGNYKFMKHYYPKPGDLREKKSNGQDAEEFICARDLDLLDEVKYWVRNLVHMSQFRMPTSKMWTYPDFVALLNDSRIFVVEYKGGDRVTNEDSKEKNAVGQLWASRSKGRAIYLMAQKVDEKGRNTREQLLAAINGNI